MSDSDREPSQLTFDVGGEEPNCASVKVSGGFPLARELRKGETIGIRIIDADGQILAEADGFVQGVGFKDHRDKYKQVTSTERTHTVKVDYR